MEIRIEDVFSMRTKSMSNGPNPFSDIIGNNKNIQTTGQAALPSRAGTTKHMYKQRKTKQGTAPRRGQQLPCKVDYHPVPRHGNTPHGNI